jgi:hypothetical protein
MDDVRVFADSGGQCVGNRTFRSESELRRFAIRNAGPLGLTVLASENPISTNGGGRIDAIAIDRAGVPAVVEFKHAVSGTAICQGLYYVDWLESHRDLFAVMVLERLGEKAATKIAWGSPRLLCVAEETGDREEVVARQIGRAVELVQVRRHAGGLVVA